MDTLKVKSRSGKRPKKRHFQGNKHVVKSKKSKVFEIRTDSMSFLSTSSKKLRDSNGKLLSSDDSYLSSECQEYRVVDISLLFNKLESVLCCNKCFNDVKIKEKSHMGLSSTFIISCKNCGEIMSMKSSKMIGEKMNVPEINRRSVLAMRCIGQGLSSLSTFCAVMGFPAPVSQKAYDAINQNILKATSNVAKSSMQNAVQNEINLTGSSDITVSGDGSWKTRGHSSLVGVCTLIGAESGKVVDTEVMSSFCKGCASYRGIKSGNRYEIWKKKHMQVCTKNHSGSASKMEVDGMLRIFSRSEESQGIRYKHYIGDGDTKTFSQIASLNPYKDLQIEKIECVGHIQKRMGTRLRKLKSQMAGKKLSDKKTIGGKGRLTESVIQKITSYYGNAIRENKNDLFKMRRSIWAIWMHMVSTDSDPQHFFCPKGPETWCKYNQASHLNKDFKHKNSVAKPIMDLIKPIFKDLSDPNLLKRCLGGRTQNSNECLNSLIWKYCPKNINSGKKIAEISTNLATVTFNDGHKGLLQVMRCLHLGINKHTLKVFQQNDMKRISEADARFSEATHEARKARKRQKTMELQQQEDEEGILYAAGAF